MKVTVGKAGGCQSKGRHFMTGRIKAPRGQNHLARGEAPGKEVEIASFGEIFAFPDSTQEP